MFLTLQFLEVHLNGRRYSPKPGICCWTHLACINVLFSFRVTGKTWTELVQTVRMPVPNWRCLGYYCLIYAAVTDLRAINDTWMGEWNSWQPGPCTGLAVSLSASSCRMVKWDFTMIFRWRCFQTLFTEWDVTLQIPQRRQSKTVLHNHNRVCVIKEASRVLYLHLKILSKAHFYQARAGKLIF